MRRVVITGLGAVTPIGGDAESTWEAMKAGRSGVGPITTFDASSYPVRIAGMIKDFEPHTDLPGPPFARHLHRAATFGVAASVEALADARLLPGVYPPEESGVAIGASVARPELQEFSDIFATRQGNGGTELLRAPPSRTLRVSQNTAAVQVARLAGCEGPFISVSTACTASAHAIGEAFRRIQDGEARMMVAGGHDALTGWVDILGF